MVIEYIIKGTLQVSCVLYVLNEMVGQAGLEPATNPL